MKRRNQHSFSYFLLALLLSLSLAAGCSPSSGNEVSTSEASLEAATESVISETDVSEAEPDTTSAPDYSNAENWAYLETEATDKTADVFFICPSVYGGSDDACNMSLSDTDTKESFVGAINMEKGIYDADSRFFSPYYRQIGLNVDYFTPRDPGLSFAQTH